MTYDVGSHKWLAAEATRLIDFARSSARPAGGFGWLDTSGQVQADRALQLWINCRTTHVVALARLHDEPDVLRLVEHGVDALRGMFAEAVAVTRERFWDDKEEMVVEKWDRDWRQLEPYRGMNSNMHATEAFLAVYALTGEVQWRDRALCIVRRVFEWGRAGSWRIPEHFDSDWQPQLHYNQADPVRRGLRRLPAGRAPGP